MGQSLEWEKKYTQISKKVAVNKPGVTGSLKIEKERQKIILTSWSNRHSNGTEGGNQGRGPESRPRSGRKENGGGEPVDN